MATIYDELPGIGLQNIQTHWIRWIIVIIIFIKYRSLSRWIRISPKPVSVTDKIRWRLATGLITTLRDCIQRMFEALSESWKWNARSPGTHSTEHLFLLPVYLQGYRSIGDQIQTCSQITEKFTFAWLKWKWKWSLFWLWCAFVWVSKINYFITLCIAGDHRLASAHSFPFKFSL